MMELVVIVLNKTDLLNDLLTQFMENDLAGATVVDSSGMGHIIANQFPMFSMFAELSEEREANSKTIFKVIDTVEERNKTVAILEEVCGDLEDPDTAIIFTLPVNFQKGINY